MIPAELQSHAVEIALERRKRIGAGAVEHADRRRGAAGEDHAGTLALKASEDLDAITTQILVVVDEDAVAGEPSRDVGPPRHYRASGREEVVAVEA